MERGQAGEESGELGPSGFPSCQGTLVYLRAGWVDPCDRPGKEEDPGRGCSSGPGLSCGPSELLSSGREAPPLVAGSGGGMAWSLTPLQALKEGSGWGRRGRGEEEPEA